VLPAAEPSTHSTAAAISPSLTTPALGSTWLVTPTTATTTPVTAAAATHAHHVPQAPTSPSPLPSGGFAGAQSAGALWTAGMAAILTALLALCLAQMLLPLRLAPARWRPLAFVSLQERPG
jgi:hypothetical protein